MTTFHEGELAVQRAAGVERDASRLAGMLDTPQLRGGAAAFLAEREFAVLAARDADGTLWASPLFDRPGFLEAADRTLTVHARPAAGDPLEHLPAGQAVGLIAVEFATRRRFRVNGTLTRAGDDLQIDVEQAYGNCPQYIQQRRLRHVPVGGGAAVPGRDEIAALVARADTFFLGTSHPTRGTDASHRGGPPGVVRVEGDTLWWPDYPGNNMFNSLGNLAVDDAAALLFVDFTTGATLQLSGSARLEAVVPGSAGDDGATGRRVRFTPRRAALRGSDLHAGEPGPSPYNPELT